MERENRSNVIPNNISIFFETFCHSHPHIETFCRGVACEFTLLSRRKNEQKMIKIAKNNEKQTKDNNFVYEYGALENDGVLKNISTILDGGNDAIKRRLLKYGE